MPKKAKKTKKIDVYLLTITGQGDTYIKLIDKETWDWIFSPWAPPSINCSSYVDTTCPPAVLGRMRKDDPDVEPYVTCGSWENDRALYVQSVYGDFDSAAEVIEYVVAHKLNVADSWEGEIY